MTDEKAELEAFVKSPGYLRMVEYARVEWRENYPAKVKLAITSAKANREDIASAVAAIDAAADAVNQVLSWPQLRLKQLQMPQAQPTLTRGGYDPTPAR